MKKLIIFALTILLITSCAKNGLPVEVTTQMDNFDVQFLFEHSGQRIYRFHDNGRYHYFMVGSGKLIDTPKTESCGKNCTTTFSENVFK